MLSLGTTKKSLGLSSLLPLIGLYAQLSYLLELSGGMDKIEK